MDTVVEIDVAVHVAEALWWIMPSSSTAKRMKRPLGDQKSELTFITALVLVLAPDDASYQMVVAGTFDLTVQKQVPSGENAHAWIECYDMN